MPIFLKTFGFILNSLSKILYLAIVLGIVSTSVITVSLVRDTYKTNIKGDIFIGTVKLIFLFFISFILLYIPPIALVSLKKSTFGKLPEISKGTFHENIIGGFLHRHIIPLIFTIILKIMVLLSDAYITASTDFKNENVNSTYTKKFHSKSYIMKTLASFVAGLLVGISVVYNMSTNPIYRMNILCILILVYSVSIILDGYYQPTNKKVGKIMSLTGTFVLLNVILTIFLVTIIFVNNNLVKKRPIGFLTVASIFLIIGYTTIGYSRLAYKLYSREIIKKNLNTKEMIQ